MNQSIPLSEIRPSKTNPRKHFDKDRLAELTDSVRKHGVLQPILVRSNGADPNENQPCFEIVAGERRFMAAKAAELTEIPAVIKDLTDQEALEIMVIENLQRDDLHPLEEAEGYRQLAKMKGYDVARIAERIGRSVKYVYDRMKLVSLVKEAKDLFLADRITAGHAILLARLKPEDQKRAIGEEDEYSDHHGGLFQRERTLFGPDGEPLEEECLKPVSVRELQAWIDEQVKLEAPDADQMILPQTAEVLAAAAEESVKVLRITHEVITPEPVRDGPKVVLGRSWERADGKHASKTCEHSKLGMVVIGPGRGEAFQVCVAKEKCSVHYGDRIRARKRAEKAGREAGAAGKDPRKAEQDRYEREEEKRKARQVEEAKERERFKKAAPALLAAAAEAIAKASPLKMVKLIEAPRIEPAARKVMDEAWPAGKDDAGVQLCRLAFALMSETIGQEWRAPAEVPGLCKLLGIDLKKILATANPEPAQAAKPPAKPRAGKKGKRT